MNDSSFGGSVLRIRGWEGRDIQPAHSALLNSTEVAPAAAAVATSSGAALMDQCTSGQSCLSIFLHLLGEMQQRSFSFRNSSSSCSASLACCFFAAQDKTRFVSVCFCRAVAFADWQSSSPMPLGTVVVVYSCCCCR